MGLEIRGLDALHRKIANQTKQLEKLHGQHETPIKEMLTPKFLAKCSRFKSVDELFDASGFVVESQEDFQAIPDGEWDDFIGANTTFADWDEMLTAAAAQWTKKSLGL